MRKLKADHEVKSKYRFVKTDAVYGAHVIVAEKALGRKMPNGAQVHHVDGNGLNNAGSNLVICPNQAYHYLLHKRRAALEFTGNANLIKCEVCGQYDEPENIAVTKARQYHRACWAAYAKQLRQRRKACQI